MIARLKPGATIADAQSQIDAHNAAVEKDNPEAKMMAEAGFRSPVLSLHADHVRSIRPTLWLMQAGVFFLLLIGAVNLMNLLLIRASGRAKEMAIRQSMGASRRHVVKQVMAETVLLTADRRIARRGRGRLGNSVAPGSRCGSFAARRAHRVRWLARVDRSRSARWFSESSSRCRSPGSTSAAISRMRSNRNRAPARLVAPLSVFATASSSRRSPSLLFCSLVRRCSG